MAPANHRGQVLVEFLLGAMLLIAVFVMAFTLSETIIREQRSSRFPDPVNSRRSRPISGEPK